MTSAKIIADSISPDGERITTMEVEFHRFVLPELNTHRVFSRNYQSSRAVPIKKMIEQVESNPACPIFWGKNQSGMQAAEEVESWDKIGGGKYQWLSAAKQAAKSAKVLHEQGYHKQIVNRLLEPFIWTKGIITASEEGFESFFKLRSHPAAQPEIKALSDKMKAEIENSKPTQLEYGDWHLPYIEVYKPLGMGTPKYSTNGVEVSLRNAIKISASCAAQVSYRNLDTSLAKAEKIYSMLNLPKNREYPEEPPHFSPAEHIAKCVDPLHSGLQNWSGNFKLTGFAQYRKLLEVGLEQNAINNEVLYVS